MLGLTIGPNVRTLTHFVFPKIEQRQGRRVQPFTAIASDSYVATTADSATTVSQTATAYSLLTKPLAYGCVAM
jgi:hypothetical protein